MARIVILGLIVALVFWWLSRNRRSARAPQAPTATPAVAQDMIACDHCGLHLPRHDALPGRGGVFCSEEHRREHEAGR